MAFLKILGVVVAVIAVVWIGQAIARKINAISLERHGRLFLSRKKIIVLAVAALLCQIALMALHDYKTNDWLGVDNAYAMLATGVVVVLLVVAYNFRIFSPRVAFPGTAFELLLAMLAAIFAVFLVVLMLAAIAARASGQVAVSSSSVRYE